MRRYVWIFTALAIAGLFVGTACAQPAVGAAGAGDAAPSTDVAKQRGTLSKMLSTTNGVIHPDGDVDPGIQRPAPATGTMPVIPPPAGSGSTGEIQPK